MKDTKGCNNEIITKMFDEIKHNYILTIIKKINDLIIERDEERVYQFKSGVLEYEEFKLNLSIPSTHGDRSDCLGTYINIKIPQYDSIGVLFIPQENGMFKYSPTGRCNLKYFNEIVINKNYYTYEECIIMVEQIINLFQKAFLMRQNLIKKLIRLKYKNIDEDIEFQEIKIEFASPVTKNRNFYLFYYSKDLNTVFFNDVFKTNYKSVINGIEEIATQIVNMNSNIDPIRTKWINIFININNSGIIFQKMELEKELHINKIDFFSKILFNKSDKEEFVSYIGVEFNTEYHIPKEEIINVWNDILFDNSLSK